MLYVGTEAQPYWARKAASPGNEHIADVQVDADGSIYITGEYGGTLQFGGQSFGSQGGLDAFVARLDATGSLVWLRRGGGAGIDRGIKLSVGSGNSIAVAGEFMGAAGLFGTTLTSTGGTVDLFVAVLNKADGTLQWVRQGGGATGVDSPGGVSMAADGSVAVAGLFRGAATWEGISLVSMNDAGTGLPTADVFIANYSSTGALLWLKHGAADMDDRAVDVVHDAANNLYITGQFSHAITFDQTYPNILVNASFLMRLAPDGTEAWFRRMGGATYNHVRDLAFAPGGELLVVGDQQGTMVWTGTGNVNVTSTRPFAYYLLKVGPNGELVAQTSVGSDSGVTVRGVAAQGSTIAILGAFNCQFADLAAHYGSDALFMAIGTEDLFVAMHELPDLSVQQAQQSGGKSAKAAGGIAYLPSGDVVFSGSFQQNLILPMASDLFGEIVPYNQAGIGNTGVVDWCGLENYGRFVGAESVGLTDGFVARSYVQGRAPYDWWVRQEGACDPVRNTPCILSQGYTCGDTLVACGSANMRVDPHFAYYPGSEIRYVGPSLNFQWSNGSTSPTITVTSSGTYWVDITSTNGCWQWTDTIEVVVHPLPPATWLSIHGEAPHPAPFGVIPLCDPDTSWIVASNLPDNGTWWWEVPYGSGPLYSDSTGADTSGTYVFHVVNEFGCSIATVIQAHDAPTVTMPDLDMGMEIRFPQDTNLTDTLWICPGSFLHYAYTPTWTVDGMVVDVPPPGLNIRWCLAPCSSGTPVDGGPQFNLITVSQAGWMVIDILVTVGNLPCGEDTLMFHGRDSIYVNLFPPINVTLGLSGPNTLCDGDTVLLTATCIDCDTFTWWTSGAGVQQGETGFLAWAPGQYMVVGMAVDTNGCTASDATSIALTSPTGPVLTLIPPDGILCPGEVAVISANAVGTNAVWYGPQGTITGQGTTLTTDAPGEYFLSLTVEGCQVTSNSVTVSSYGTPYLSAGDQTALCFPGDEVVIAVTTVPGVVVAWAAPLSGNALTQSVNQPGTYTCMVTACGITTSLSIDVVSAPVHAELITPGPYTLCPEDTLVLQAASGANAYVWLPGPVSGPELVVTQAGAYRVAVSNVEGCSDTSAAVLVAGFVFSDPVHAIGDTVCAGDVAQVTASGSGILTWYAGAGSNTPLGNGSPMSFVPVASGMIHVRQSEGNCTSWPDSAWVEVAPRPPAVWITGPDSLCVGEELVLQVNVGDTLQYTWTGPGGGSEGESFSIPSVATTDMGVYTCTPFYHACSGIPAAHILAVIAPGPTGLPEEMSLCEGGFATVGLPAGFSNVLWSNGSSLSTLTLTGPVDLTVQATDMHGCHVEGQVSVVIVDCDLVVPNVFSPNGDGVNDGWSPTGGFMQAVARIRNRWGALVYEGDLVVRGWDGRNYLNGTHCSDGTYYFELELIRADGQVKYAAGHLQLLGSGR